MLCEVDRGGYIRAPLLLPFARLICYISKSLIRSAEECSNDREILKKTCKSLKNDLKSSSVLKYITNYLTYSYFFQIGGKFMVRLFISG